jgi:hypothetical protein
MTTLGDVFSKLSGVRLMSILKWYGRIVMWTAFSAIVLFVLTGLVFLVIAIVSSIPWWFTVGLLVLASAWVALKIADPDALRSDFERDMDKMNRDILMGNGLQKTVQAGEAEAEHNSPYNFHTANKIRNWGQIRELVAALDADTGCTIELDGKPFAFPNRQAALDFLDSQ